MEKEIETEMLTSSNKSTENLEKIGNTEYGKICNGLNFD